MTTTAQRQEAITEARRKAEQEAFAWLLKATDPNATEADENRVLEAIITVRMARRGERYISAEQAERVKASIAAFGRAKREELAAEVIEGKTPIEQAEARYAAAMDVKETEIDAQIDRHQLATWLRAIDELALLGRARAAEIHQAGEARH